MIHYFLDLRARECVNFFSLHGLSGFLLVYSLYVSLKRKADKEKKNLSETYIKDFFSLKNYYKHSTFYNLQNYYKGNGSPCKTPSPGILG